MFQSVGQYTKAEEYYQKALTMTKEIGDKSGVGASYLNLGKLCRVFQHYARSQQFAEKALEVSYEIGDIELQFSSHLGIALNTLSAGEDITVVKRNLYERIKKCEDNHGFLRGKEQFKISFFDAHASPYHLLCWLFIMERSYYEALNIAELGRSRELADILSDKYSVKKEISVNTQSWIGIENIMDTNAFSSCLYVSCFADHMCFWILKPNKTVVSRRTRLKGSAHKVFGNKKSGGSRDLRQEQCEDRSLFSLYERSPTSCKPSQDESSSDLCLIEKEDEAHQESKLGS